MRFAIVVILTLTHFTLLGSNAKRHVVDSIHNEILSLNSPFLNPRLLNNVNINNEDLSWLKANALFFDFLTSSELPDYERIQNQLSRYIQVIEKATYKSPWIYYYLSDVYLFKAYVKFKQQKLYNAFRYYGQAMDYHSLNMKWYPKWEHHTKHLLVKYHANKWIKSNVPLLISNITFTNLEESLGNRQKVFLSSLKVLPVSKREYSMLQVLLNDLSGDSELALNNLNALPEEWQLQGPIELYISQHVYTRNLKYTKALYLLEQGKDMRYFSTYNRLNLNYGVALLNAHINQGVGYLHQFLSAQNRIEGKAYAHLKLAWWHAIQGNADSVQVHAKEIFSGKASSLALDKQALNEVSNQDNWDKILLDARLWFDAGNYNLSKSMLLHKSDTIANLNKAQQLEYAYRLARCYHQLKDYDKAQNFYQIVIDSNLDKKFYYAAYSAYYQASIYSILGKTNKAKHKYKECISLDSPVYKRSIHQKAKQALSSL